MKEIRVENGVWWDPVDLSSHKNCRLIIQNNTIFVRPKWWELLKWVHIIQECRKLRAWPKTYDPKANS